jgi:hypothetical protein
MQILISLNYEKMNECKLVFKGKSLNNKALFLRDVFDVNAANEVTVTGKNELEAYAEQFGSVVEMFHQYPTYFVGGIVALVFLILYLVGE